MLLPLVCGALVALLQPCTARVTLSKAPAASEGVERVHLVWMSHFDLGYTHAGRDVCDLYFDTLIGQHIDLAEALAATNDTRYVWTSHPWLLLEALDGTAGCRHGPLNTATAARLQRAIERGHVQWQGLPFSMFPELADAGLLAHGMTLRDRLNARFQRTHGNIAAKITDVTGLSRSVIPVLHAAGVRVLHIGYNANCAIASVPPVFVWRHGETGTELVVMVEHNYGTKVAVGGMRDVLLFQYGEDNREPYAQEKVAQFWADARFSYPTAHVHASSLDAFGRALLEARHLLPVLEMEIGDSWLYGAAADPYKLAALREARRYMEEASRQGLVSGQDEAMVVYSRRLLTGNEHNWGLSVGTWTPALWSTEGNWSTASFQAAIGQAEYKMLGEEWADQRTFVEPQHVQALLKAPPSQQWLRFSSELSRRQHLLKNPFRPDPSKLHPITGPVSNQCGTLEYKIDAGGAISWLQDTATGRVYAREGHTLGLVCYQTFSEADFDSYNREYNPNCGPPCADFAKVGMHSASANATMATASLTGAYTVGGDPCRLVLGLSLPEEAVKTYGAPAQLWANVTFGPGRVDLAVAWFDKTATRLAEALWLSFVPPLEGTRVGVDVLGHTVDPLAVVGMGTQKLHGTWSGVSWQRGQHTILLVESLDAALVSPGKVGQLLRYDNTQRPDTALGMHYVLYNNLWGTAFPQWYANDALFRFSMHLA